VTVYKTSHNSQYNLAIVDLTQQQWFYTSSMFLSTACCRSHPRIIIQGVAWGWSTRHNI